MINTNETLKTQRERLLLKRHYLREIVKREINDIQIIVQSSVYTPTGKKIHATHYINEYDTPFNLQLELSILLHDSIEYLDDQIKELEFKIEDITDETKLDNNRGNI